MIYLPKRSFDVRRHQAMELCYFGCYLVAGRSCLGELPGCCASALCYRLFVHFAVNAIILRFILFFPSLSHSPSPSSLFFPFIPGLLLLILSSLFLSPSLTTSTLQMMSPLAVEKEWFVSKDVLQEVLAPHPKLRAAIFPPPPKKGTPAETQDISLYQLLQVRGPE